MLGMKWILFLPIFLFGALIDVVIPCVEKDLETLDLCIAGIKKFGMDIGRVIIVSDKKLTDQAEWFDEKLFPFDKWQMAEEIFGDKEAGDRFVAKPKSRIGWLYQQL